MPNIPQREPFREKDLRQLENIYKRAGRNIMATFDEQTDFEQFRRAGIMRQIEQILADAGVETGAMVRRGAACHLPARHWRRY